VGQPALPADLLWDTGAGLGCVVVVASRCVASPDPAVNLCLLFGQWYLARYYLIGSFPDHGRYVHVHRRGAADSSGRGVVG
jgi:hypothetical protein